MNIEAKWSWYANENEQQTSTKKSMLQMISHKSISLIVKLNWILNPPVLDCIGIVMISVLIQYCKKYLWHFLKYILIYLI